MKKEIYLLIAFSLIIFSYSVYSIFSEKKEVNLLTENISAIANIVDTSIQNFQEGDIIFQTSLSQQSEAIQLATKSQYSHCGIIFSENGQFYVLEAIQPVTKTPLKKWIERGKNQHFIVKRLHDAQKILNDSIITAMKIFENKMINKDYDLTFEWSDEKLYCSELVWKIYQRTTGIELCPLEKLTDFDLSNNIVQKKLLDRYGDNFPWNEQVISPQKIFESKLLITIHNIQLQ